jgi:DNA-binding transcriptional regulator GbsR (MarR family)
VTEGGTWHDGRAEFVATASSELAAQGFPPMPARVIMALTASDEGRLTADELQAVLGVSAAGVSGGVRYLMALGFIRRGMLAGSRRHVYTLPEGSAWYTVSLTRPGLYAHVVSVLAEGSRSLPEASPARARIDEMIDFFRFIDERMPALLDEWKARRGPASG